MTTAMVSLLVALPIALVVPLLTGGSYPALVRRGWRWVTVGVLGVAVQVALVAGLVPPDRGHDLGAGLLVASLVLLAGFATANLVRPGMGVVLVGLGAVAVAVGLNHGMPVAVPEGADPSEAPWATTATHRPREPGDRLVVLTDVIVVTTPVRTSLSFGALVVAVGVVDASVHASRRRGRAGRSRRRTARLHDPVTAVLTAGAATEAGPAIPPSRPRPDPRRRPAAGELVRPVRRVPAEPAAAERPAAPAPGARR